MATGKYQFDIAGLTWVRPEKCNQVECAETAELPDGGTALRNSAYPEVVLFYNKDEWDAFVSGVKNDEFNVD